jgi:hypothetical protein
MSKVKLRNNIGMTKILVPFVYYVYENAQKVEKIGYYDDELSNVYPMCKQCLSIHDRHSAYCLLCSEEYKAGEHEAYIPRLKKNQALIDASQKKIVEKLKKGGKPHDVELNRWGRTIAVLNGDKDGNKSNKAKRRPSANKVRGKGKDVVQDDIQANPVKGKRRASSKGRTKAGVV